MKKDLTMFGYVLRFAAVLAVVTLLAACGKSNDAGLQLSAVNKHPADWLTAHRSAYLKTPDVCRSCHGTDLTTGGVTKIDCFNQADLGQCHAGGHGPRPVAHALPFTDPVLHGAMAKKDLIICQDCHGEPGATGGSGAGSNPRFTKPIGSLSTGCEASGCHLVYMAHPKPWKGHRDAGNIVNVCALCHGSSFEGSVNSKSPACKECHTQLIAGRVPDAGQCKSCHGNPPSGTTSPNRAGSHAVHLALGGMTGNCAACHANGGTGTSDHGSTLPVAADATVAFASNFSVSPSLTALYTATAATPPTSRCSNVACHGGQQTPNWYGGAIDVSTKCDSCHTLGTTGGYISPNSGKHSYHLVDIETKLKCSDCHDMSSGAHHFKNVTTTNSFETLPSSTLRSYLSYNAVTQSCTVQKPLPAGVSFTACHTGLDTTKNWIPK